METVPHPPILGSITAFRAGDAHSRIVARYPYSRVRGAGQKRQTGQHACSPAGPSSVAAIALADTTARIAWAVLVKTGAFTPPVAASPPAGAVRRLPPAGARCTEAMEERSANRL
jgi:hypothetical protein